MGGFWSSLGQGLADYGKSRLQKSPLGGLYDAFSGGDQGFTSDQMPMDTQMATDPTVRSTARNADPNAALSDAISGAEPMAGGKLVTSPTVAMLAEHGQPEAVIPLDSMPGQKMSASMMGGLPGGLPVRSRYRRPSGANAAKLQAPIRSDIPLGANRFFR